MGEPETYELLGAQIFASGKWNGDNYNEADLDAMVAAFSEVGFNPPLKLGHDSSQPLAKSDGMPAIGWVKNLRRIGDKLVCDLQNLPKKVYEAIKRKNYDRVSAEIYWDWSSNGKTWPRVLKALSLLGAEIPAVTDLAALETLYDAKGLPFKRYDMGMMDYPSMPTPYPLKDKATVHYRTGEAQEGGLASVCGSCRFFTGPADPDGEGQYVCGCMIVSGPIASGQVCDLYEPNEAFQSFMTKTEHEMKLTNVSAVAGKSDASMATKDIAVDENEKKIAELTAQLAASAVEKTELEKKYSDATTKVTELSQKLPEAEQKLATLEAEKAELTEKNRVAAKQSWFTSITTSDNLKLIPAERAIADHLYDVLDGAQVKAYAAADGKDMTHIEAFKSLFESRKPGTMLFTELSVGNATVTAGSPDVKTEIVGMAQAKDEAVKRAKQYMQEHSDTPFKSALEKVYEADPGLKELSAGITSQGEAKADAGRSHMERLFPR